MMVVIFVNVTLVSIAVVLLNVTLLPIFIAGGPGKSEVTLVQSMAVKGIDVKVAEARGSPPRG